MLAALRDGRPAPQAAGQFEQRAVELIGWLRGDPSADPSAELASPRPPAWPGQTGVPEIWSFGTGRSSADLAARQGTAFGYSLFHHFSKDDTSSLELYRERFVPSAGRAAPLAAVAVAGICAETDREAEALKARHQNSFLIPTVVGSPQHCRQRIEAISERYAASELVFLDLSPSHPSRLRSMGLLAEEFELKAEADGDVGRLAIEGPGPYTPAA
jgi:alkanesulfonate monooxygenase SsuD/methylene tetrahydromethanopterin reductase-like flavin-dependent oxidoreductase (luciferase family)